jgi:mRNA-degrading endonuclease HigB of HigAB toxin-antitoxin module
MNRTFVSHVKLNKKNSFEISNLDQIIVDKHIIIDIDGKHLKSSMMLVFDIKIGINFSPFEAFR